MLRWDSSGDRLAAASRR